MKKAENKETDKPKEEKKEHKKKMQKSFFASGTTANQKTWINKFCKYSMEELNLDVAADDFREMKNFGI